ncbi:MAG: hypothetical protein JJT78_10150 [Leptospira sp.]|nr:hypothetical protein [Leptospira sp.]
MSTDIKKNMRYYGFFSNFFLICIFATLITTVVPIHSSDWEDVIWKKSVVLDFETGEFSSKNWRQRGMGRDISPDVFITRNITAPLPGSRRALLFRFHENTNIPGEFIFPQTIEFADHVKELEFPIYSSKSGGSLSVILQTHDYENKKLFLTNLNFRGWKNITLTVRERLNQNDPVLNSKLVIRLIGIIYEPQRDTPYGTEILVGMDDISATTRTKYRILADPASLLE